MDLLSGYPRPMRSILPALASCELEPVKGCVVTRRKRDQPMKPMQVFPIRFLAAFMGCSSAPLPPPVEARPRPPAPAPSASVAPAPPAASTAADVAPAAEVDQASEAGDLVKGGARLALEDGAELVVAVKDPADPASPPPVAMALVRDGKVIARREGFAAVTGVESKLLTAAQSCESWRASLRRESSGSVEGVRVSIASAIGEDFSTSTELAVLFKINAPLRTLDGLARIWSGVAAREENKMDSCLTSREVGFRVPDAKTLEKTITERTWWVEQVIGGDVKKQLKRDCKVGTKKRVERVALP